MNRGNRSHDSFYGDPSTDVSVDKKRVASQRQLRIRGLWANYEEAETKLLQLVGEARDEQDWEHLGYKSWTAYLADTVGEEKVKLAAGRRQELVGMLSSEGMSTRAIATTLGVSKNTVTADLRQVSQSGTPELPFGSNPGDEFFSDAEERDAVMIMSSVPEEEFETAIQQARSEGDLSRENVVAKIGAPTRITGLDGKSYAKSKVAAAPSKPPRRRPLPDAYRSALYDLGKATERIDRLTTDDRFKSHVEEYRTIWGNDLLRSIQSLTANLESFDLDGHDAPVVEAM